MHLEKKKDSSIFLQFCDELRDNICIDLGINLRDDDKVLFVLGDPTQLRKEIQINNIQQQEQQKEKEIEKIKKSNWTITKRN